MNDTAHRNALHSGYELFWYRIERVLGQGEYKSSVVSDIKKWFKETAEKDSEIKKEETASDRVIKSMGGK